LICFIKSNVFNCSNYENNSQRNVIKGVIRSRKSKDRQCNDQNKKYKRTNTDLQHITQKTKDRTTGTPLKTTNL
jgi:hypothetical protein